MFKHVKILIGTLALLCLMTACEELPSHLEMSHGSIYGVITDFATGKRIQNATVQLRPLGETALSGADGMYEFINVPDGDYTIVVSKYEYSDLIDDYVIRVTSGRHVRRDVQIEKLPAVSN